MNKVISGGKIYRKGKKQFTTLHLFGFVYLTQTNASLTLTNKYKNHLFILVYLTQTNASLTLVNKYEKKPDTEAIQKQKAANSQKKNRKKCKCKKTRSIKINQASFETKYAKTKECENFFKR